MESNHHSQWPRGYNPESSPVLSVRMKGWPVGFEPTPAGITTPGAAVTPRPPCMSGDDRFRTGDRSPDKRVLCRLSYAPKGRATRALPAQPFQ